MSQPYPPPRAPLNEGNVFALTFVAVLLALFLWTLASPIIDGVLEAVAPDWYCDTIECVVANS